MKLDDLRRVFRIGMEALGLRRDLSPSGSIESADALPSASPNATEDCVSEEQMNRLYGLNVNRIHSNPEEKRIAEAWNKQDVLEWILGGGVRAPNVSERDRDVAASVIQWLGSPVGQQFLSSIGYERRTEREYRKPN